MNRLSIVNCREKNILKRVGGVEIQPGTEFLVTVTTKGGATKSTEMVGKSTPHQALQARET